MVDTNTSIRINYISVVGDGSPEMSEIIVETEVKSSSSVTEQTREPTPGTLPAEPTRVQSEPPDQPEQTATHTTTIDTNVSHYPCCQRKKDKCFSLGRTSLTSCELTRVPYALLYVTVCSIVVRNIPLLQ